MMENKPNSQYPINMCFNFDEKRMILVLSTENDTLI